MTSSTSIKECKQKVNDILKRLQLEGCADTIIGGIFRKGLSGG
jgi:hypothetical protein